MKTLKLAALLFAIIASFALTACGTAPQAATAQSDMFKLDILVSRGAQDVVVLTLNARDGETATYQHERKHPYTAKIELMDGELVKTPAVATSGMTLHATPHRTPDGKIAVELAFVYSDLTSPATIAVGDKDGTTMQQLELQTRNVVRTFTLEDGKAVLVSLGAATQPASTGDAGQPQRAQYTLKLTATRA